MFLLPFLPFFVSSTYALSIPFARRAPTHSTSVSINPHYSGNLGWTNDGDFLYTATVYVQGQPFQVQIDSGSSDLWINTQGVTFEGLIETGFNATIGYIDTTVASGPVVLGNVSLGEFTVNGQAFINAPGSNASTAGLDVGLLGVGPPFASSVYSELQNSSYDGLPFLTNVFALNPSEPNFITFLLSRSNLGMTDGGVMSISELVSEYTAVTDSTKLRVISPSSWETFMDGVYVNGQFFTGHSLGAEQVTAEPGPYQTTIVLDTGTSLASAPQYYVDAMYKNLPGAVWNDSLSTYTLPCSTKVNISMVFGSDLYPINPIDSTYLNVENDGSFWCQGTFSATPSTAEVDFILGDSFLRNVYMLLNFGSNFTGNGDEPPYMQVLSITNADQSWAEFDWLNIQRIVQQEYATFVNSTSTAEAASETLTYSLVAPSSTAAASSPITTSSHKSASTASHSSAASTSSGLTKDKQSADLAAAVEASPSPGASSVDVNGLLRNSYIIMGLLGGVLVLLIGVLIKVLASSRNPQYKQVPTAIPPAHFGKPYEPDSETFSTPYDDAARPLY